MPHKKNLTDLPELLPNLVLLTVHGEGRGGGEKVAGQIKTAFAAQGRNLEVVPARQAKKAIIKLKKNVLTERRDIEESDSILLFSSGPRDLPLMLHAIRHGIPFAVYMQVPYKKAITWRDPIHALATLAYIKVSSLASSMRIANSKTTADSFGRTAEIILPVASFSYETPSFAPHPIQKSTSDDKQVTLVTACRYYPERGRGSRDLDAVERLLTECRAHNSRSNIKVSVRHYGDVHPEIRARFKNFEDVLSFRGFNPSWIHDEKGPFFFFSVYEGFGLAAYEAAQAGKTVFVNGAFPSDLVEVNSSIKRIDTRTRDQSLLRQLLNASSPDN